MKICIIHGSPRKGNTYTATEILKKELKKIYDYEFTEFFLPKDMPNFCCGCYSCIDKSEDKCPHIQYIKPITDAIRDADGIILTSPVYVMAESGAMKALLDHYGYLYMAHRPMEEMFNKIALVVSTTAGAGTRYSIKTIARSLSFWGVKRIYKVGLAIQAKNWSEMSIERQQKFTAALAKKATIFHKALQKRDKLLPRIFKIFFFSIMKKMIADYDDSNIDKIYWKQKGWIK